MGTEQLTRRYILAIEEILVQVEGCGTWFFQSSGSPSISYQIICLKPVGLESAARVLAVFCIFSPRPVLLEFGLIDALDWQTVGAGHSSFGARMSILFFFLFFFLYANTKR